MFSDFFLYLHYSRAGIPIHRKKNQDLKFNFSSLQSEACLLQDKGGLLRNSLDVNS